MLVDPVRHFEVVVDAPGAELRLQNAAVRVVPDPAQHR